MLVVMFPFAGWRGWSDAGVLRPVAPVVRPPMAGWLARVRLIVVGAAGWYGAASPKPAAAIGKSLPGNCLLRQTFCNVA